MNNTTTTSIAPLRPGTDLLPVTPTREQIDRFEAMLFEHAAEVGETAIETTEHHADGVYARAIRIPAGVALTGLPHRVGALNVSNGDITVWTEQGMRRLTGVHVIASQPGAKRVGFAHADTMWLTVHANPLGLTGEALEAAMVEEPERLASRRLALPALDQPLAIAEVSA